VSTEVDAENEAVIEIIEADEDLTAVVEDALEDSTPIKQEVANVGLLAKWWSAQDSHLGHILPELSFLQKVEAIRGTIILSVSTFVLQCWNLIFGIASSSSGFRNMTIDWWRFLFSSGQDSFEAPYLMDPLGWVLLIGSFTILISTMPHEAKD
jgi:hypothetical protein